LDAHRRESGIKHSVTPFQAMARVTIEQVSTFGWTQHIGLRDAVAAMKMFGT